MYRVTRICFMLLLLLGTLSACSLRPAKPDCGAELALDNGQALGYNLSVVAEATGENHIVAEFVYHYNGSLYETGAFELQQLLKNQYLVSVSGQGWVPYRQFVFTDGTHDLPLGSFLLDPEAQACYACAAMPQNFDPETAVLDTRKTDGESASVTDSPDAILTGAFPAGETQADYTLAFKECFHFISRTREMEIEGRVKFKDTYSGWNIRYSDNENAYILKDADTGAQWRICLAIDGEPVEIPKDELKESRFQTVEGKLTGFTFDFSLGDRFTPQSEASLFVEALD